MEDGERLWEDEVVAKWETGCAGVVWEVHAGVGWRT